ncbi:hypothetical protein ACWF94_04970 [Streptomyces sp. NPDC055078]
MNTQSDLEGLGTDELHTLMVEALQELPSGHPVRVLWDRMDEFLTDGGPEGIPAPPRPRRHDAFWLPRKRQHHA